MKSRSCCEHVARVDRRKVFFGLPVIAAGVASARGATRCDDSSQPASSVIQVTHYRTKEVDGVKIFYREAGPENAPVLLLLHGFPTSSHMFRNLMPLPGGSVSRDRAGLSRLWTERHA